MSWKPEERCHDCAGPRYRDTARCAYHGLRHTWKDKGIELPPPVVMWSRNIKTRKLPKIILPPEAQ